MAYTSYDIEDGIDEAANALADSEVDLSIDRDVIKYLMLHPKLLSPRETLEHADTIIDRAYRLRNYGSLHPNRRPWLWIGLVSVALLFFAWVLLPGH